MREFSEEHPRNDLTDPYLRLHHVPVFVRDHDRSLRFFVDQLGFTLVVDYRFGEHSRFILVSPPDGTAMLALIAPSRESREYGLIGHFWQPVFVTEDVEAKYRLWRDRGVQFLNEPKATSWGGTVATFADVDGNTFVLAGWDDMTREIESRRRLIAEKQESDRRAVLELEIAREVQARLFPQTAPELRTLDYAGICIQARDVGGDYYDFMDLGRDHLGIVIADISGKGISAALLMANLQANLRSQSAMALQQPQGFLRSVNRLFYENTNDSAYATLFFAEYDDREQRLRYANCGHVSGLLLRNDLSLERLNSTCGVVGLFPDWDCSMEERELLSGDTVVLYTDGVTESFSETGEEFGEERLVAAIMRLHGLGAKELLEGIAHEVRLFSPREKHDDVTLIVARCKGKRTQDA